MPVLTKAQSAYDPPTTATFAEATAGMTVVDSYTFGTAAGNNITNLQQLSASFNPYGIAGQQVINSEWERYQPFNSTNFVFTPTSLNLTATIPVGGGLYSGGIHSGQIWSQKTFQPGKTGQPIYAMSARAKIPSGQGMWPAFWLFSPMAGDISEVDIYEFEMMEYQNQFDWTGNDAGPGKGARFYSILSNPYTWHPGTDFSADFHDYQLIWTPDATYKYVDGQLILAQFLNWTSNQPAQIGVNLAVGSNAASLPGLTPTSLAEFPSAVQLQSITVMGGSVAASAGTSATASYTGLDTTTQGTWSGQYGKDGYVVANGVNNAPTYSTVSVGAEGTYTWAAETTDPRALQTSLNSATRMASTYYSSAGFTFYVNLTDGNTHQMALYLLDWDKDGRVGTVQILDAVSHQVLDSRTFSSFEAGQYGTWTIKGNVIVQVTPNAGDAVASALFFGPSPSAAASTTPTVATASYRGLDTATQGTWTGKYGSTGFAMANGGTSLPGTANFSVTGDALFTWARQSSDVRALQTSAGASTRLAASYYSPTLMDLHLNLPDGNTHQVALYLLDWDGEGIVEKISVKDAVTSQVLDTEMFSNFKNGQYAVWNVKGNVVIEVASVAGTGSVSGVFLK